MIEKAKEFAAEPGTYFTDQINNPDSIVGYRNIGDEIIDQLDRPIDGSAAQWERQVWRWGWLGRSPKQALPPGSLSSSPLRLR